MAFSIQTEDTWFWSVERTNLNGSQKAVLKSLAFGGVWNEAFIEKALTEKCECEKQVSRPGGC